MPVNGFIQWIKQFQNDDNPRGDLARDMMRDRVLRNTVLRNFSSLHKRLIHRVDNRNVLQTAYEAWLTYKTIARTTREEAKELLAYAKSVCPTLEPNGVGNSDRRFDEEDCEHYLDEIALCADWLSLQKRRKTLNQSAGSYSMKHRVEELTGRYISNGSLIAAAIALRIPFRQYPEYKNPNVYFALSSSNNLETPDWNNY